MLCLVATMDALLMGVQFEGMDSRDFFFVVVVVVLATLFVGGLSVY